MQTDDHAHPGGRKELATGGELDMGWEWTPRDYERVMRLRLATSRSLIATGGDRLRVPDAILATAVVASVAQTCGEATGSRWLFDSVGGSSRTALVTAADPAPDPTVLPPPDSHVPAGACRVVRGPARRSAGARATRPTRLLPELDHVLPLNAEQGEEHGELATPPRVGPDERHEPGHAERDEAGDGARDIEWAQPRTSYCAGHASNVHAAGGGRNRATVWASNRATSASSHARHRVAHPRSLGVTPFVVGRPEDAAEGVRGRDRLRDPRADGARAEGAVTSVRGVEGRGPSRPRPSPFAHVRSSRGRAYKASVQARFRGAFRCGRNPAGVACNLRLRPALRRGAEGGI